MKIIAIAETLGGTVLGLGDDGIVYQTTRTHSEGKANSLGAYRFWEPLVSSTDTIEPRGE